MSDVVDLKAFKNKKDEPATETDQSQDGAEKVETKKEEVDSTEAFKEVLRKNEENRQRMKKEREKANKGVIRSYRLKH
jgi:molecular chaperone GrpE (heat shock protein)